MTVVIRQRLAEHEEIAGIDVELGLENALAGLIVHRDGEREARALSGAMIDVAKQDVGVTTNAR